MLGFLNVWIKEFAMNRFIFIDIFKCNKCIRNVINGIYTPFPQVLGPEITPAFGVPLPLPDFK